MKECSLNGTQESMINATVRDIPGVHSQLKSAYCLMFELYCIIKMINLNTVHYNFCE
jgi:hypothetical protein